MSKTVALMLLALLVLSSLSMVGSAFTQSIPNPSVPEFTLEFIDESYDVPATYEIDPYTGKNVSHPSYHVPQIALKMTIKNQPFVPYYDEESEWNIAFFYNIRMKGSYSEDWIELYRPSDGYPHQSETEYTVISLGTLGGAGLALRTSAKMIDVPSGGKVDFQVEAMIGYVHRGGVIILPGSGWTFTGEKSGWSSTQTLTIPVSSAPSASPTSPALEQTEPTATPYEESQSIELEIILVVTVIVAVLGTGFGLLLYFIKRK